MGEAQASQFFKDLANDRPTDSEVSVVNEFWNETSKAARGVVELEELQPFIKTMLRGRFENL